MGIVEYDPETGIVKPTAAVADLKPFFELVEIDSGRTGKRGVGSS